MTTPSLSSPSRYPNFSFQEPSILHQIKDMTLNGVWNVWISASCYFKTLPVDPDLISKITKDDRGDPNAFSAVKKLADQRPIGSNALIIHAGRLSSLHPHFLFFPGFLHPEREVLKEEIRSKKDNPTELETPRLYLALTDPTQDLPKKEVFKEKDVKLLAIPIILSSSLFDGLLSDHIVTFLIDLEANRIEFYDSKGLVCKDHSGRRLLANKTLDLPNLVHCLLGKYGDGETTFYENNTCHQSDVHNCGVYVADYYIQRAQGVSAEKISASPKDLNLANEVRKQMISTIAGEALPASANRGAQQFERELTKPEGKLA